MDFITTPVYVWGSNEQGQLPAQLKAEEGLPSPTRVNVPRPTVWASRVPSSANEAADKLRVGTAESLLGETTAPTDDSPYRDSLRVVQVACSEDSTFVLTADGKVLGWGRNTHGELGLGSISRVERPTTLRFMTDEPIVKIRCGTHSLFALTSSGELYYTGLSGFPNPVLSPAPFSEMFMRAAVSAASNGRSTVAQCLDDVAATNCSLSTRFHDVAFATHYGLGVTRKNREVFAWGHQGNKTMPPLLVPFFVGRRAAQVSACCTDPSSSSNTIFVVLMAEGGVLVWSPRTNALCSTTPVPLPSLPPRCTRVRVRCGKSAADLWALSEGGDLFHFDLRTKRSTMIESASSRRLVDVCPTGEGELVAWSSEGESYKISFTRPTSSQDSAGRSHNDALRSLAIAATVTGIPLARPEDPQVSGGELVPYPGLSEHTVKQVAAGGGHFIALTSEYKAPVTEGTLRADLMKAVGVELHSDHQIFYGHGLKFAVHKCILRVRCPMLLSPPAGSMEGVSEAALRQVLVFAYSGVTELDYLSVFEVIQVIHLARVLHLGRLAFFATYQMETQLQDDNALLAADWSFHRGLTEATGVALRFIARNNVTAKASKEHICRLHKELMADITRVNADIHAIDDEYPIFDWKSEPPPDTFDEDMERMQMEAGMVSGTSSRLGSRPASAVSEVREDPSVEEGRGEEFGDVTLVLPYDSLGEDIDTGSEAGTRVPYVFRAHRIILHVRSSSLSEIIKDGTEEVLLENVRCTGAAFITFLRFLYTDMADIPLKDAVYMSGFHRQFGLSSDRLQVLINYALLQKLSEENCLGPLVAADALGKESLKRHCIEMACRNWDRAVFTADVYSLPRNLLIELMQAKALAGDI